MSKSADCSALNAFAFRTANEKIERARSTDRSLVVVPGHTDDYDRVLMETDAYVIVEKIGRAGDVAETAAP